MYNWQYVHCVDFWAIVIARACDKQTLIERGGQESELRALIYPLVQVALGAARYSLQFSTLLIRVLTVRLDSSTTHARSPSTCTSSAPSCTSRGTRTPTSRSRRIFSPSSPRHSPRRPSPRRARSARSTSTRTSARRSSTSKRVCTTKGLRRRPHFSSPSTS